MSQPILLLNAGSSSIKYRLIDMADESVLASGLIERIGQDQGQVTHKLEHSEFRLDGQFPDHTRALEAMVAQFNEHGPSLDDVVAVGHRTVHGGDRLTRTMVIDDDVIRTLEELSPLAPLHNPPGIAGIRGAQQALPNVPHVAVFDTAFFADLPPHAYTYAIDRDVAREHSIRRYGFHGTSHNYVSHEAAKMLGKPYDQVSQIVCHLGNGASISAIKNGRPIDTTMGLTPLEGLVMGTRSGDIDPGIIFYLARLGWKPEDIDNLLNKKSGMLGLCGMSDMRDIEDAKAVGDPDAILAWDVYTHRIIGYIGNYVAQLGGVDCITFTAGVGENSAAIRRDILFGLGVFGIRVNLPQNALRTKVAHDIARADSPVRIYVIPTNEELQMAREVVEVLG